MNEEFVEFLKYGLSGIVKKKDIWAIDCIMMFFSLFLALADGYISLKWGIPSTIIVVTCIILTYTKEDVKGSKIFLVYGAWGSCFTLIFGLFGVRVLLPVLDKKKHFIFISILIIAYIMVTVMYISIIKHLIKKGAYKETRKTNGKMLCTIAGVGGISLAKTFVNSAGYERTIQIASICAFLMSFLSLLGVFNFYKYFYLKKLGELD